MRILCVGMAVLIMACLAGCAPDPVDTAPTALAIAEDEIYHFGFVVEDLEAAIRDWAHDHGVGPFFVFRDFSFDNPSYRGEASAPKVSLAFGFSGKIMIELIQQLDETPSVYTELIERRGYGFHHFAFLVSDVDASVSRAEMKGHECIFRSDFAGGRLAYCEPDGPAGTGLTEFVQRSPDVESLLDMMYQASVGWNGEEPVREIE